MEKPRALQRSREPSTCTAGSRAPSSWSRKVLRVMPGLLLVLAVAGVATVLGRWVPLVGGPVFGIVLGAMLAASVPAARTSQALQPGLSFASKRVLQYSIVVLGTGLSLRQVLRVGGQSLPVMLGTLTVALLGAVLLGRLLGVRGDGRILIGVGTGICGASAIAATTAVIGAAETDIAYAVGTIFSFNIAAVLLFPPLGHVLGMGPHAFGLWSGTAINDTSSVLAAAYAYGGHAGDYSIVVKLTRTLMLVPIVIGLAVWKGRKGGQGADGVTRLPWSKIVPWFLLGFLLASATDTVGLIPAAWHNTLSALGTFLITTALAAIGLSLRLSAIRHAGARPLLLGAGLWVAVAATSLALQELTGQI